VRVLRESGSPGQLLADCLRQNRAARESIASVAVAGRWHSIGPLRFATRRPSAAGMLFVGDAAGTIDPFCGEGISHALLAAEMALPVALRALSRGSLDRELARDYERSWRRRFAPVTRRARLLGMVLARSRLAGCAIGLLHGVERSWLPRLVHGTR
jgi:flavin-dependent dehydrogenase